MPLPAGLGNFDVCGLCFFLLYTVLYASYDGGCGVRNASSISVLSNGVLFVGVPINSGLIGVSSTRMVRNLFRVRKGISSAILTSLCVSSRYVVPLIVRPNRVSVRVSGTKVAVGKAPLGSYFGSFIIRGGSLSSHTCRMRHRRDHVVVSKGSLRAIRRRVRGGHSRVTARVGRLTGAFVRSGCRGMLKPRLFVVLNGDVPCPFVAPLVRRVVSTTPRTFGGGCVIGRCISITHRGVSRTPLRWGRGQMEGSSCPVFVFLFSAFLFSFMFFQRSFFGNLVKFFRRRNLIILSFSL